MYVCIYMYYPPKFFLRFWGALWGWGTRGGVCASRAGTNTPATQKTGGVIGLTETKKGPRGGRWLWLGEFPL